MSTHPCLPVLRAGTITLKGQFMRGYNYTFLVEVSHEGHTIQAVYKPTGGERPLWDFPPETLAGREVAAYLVSEALGWNLVPPTVYTPRGPSGPGSLQLHIPHDPEHHFFHLTPEEKQHLRPIALFDILVNNADRKGGHFLVDAEGHIWSIDHGICFHEEPKLRTVLWDFAGEPLPEPLCAGLQTLRAQLAPGEPLPATLQAYLNPREIAALTHRLENLLATGRFPHPPTHTRPYPWPLI